MAQHNFEDGEAQLILSPHTYSMYRNRSNGDIMLVTGPKQESPSKTDEPMRFSKRKGFFTCPMYDSVQPNVVVVKNQYVVLYNPEVGEKFPKPGQKYSGQDFSLDIGRKVTIVGPANFALWPGQFHELIPGHHLRSNEYLVIRINDEEQAKDNWTQSVVKKTDSDSPEPTKDAGIQTPKFTAAPDDLAVGKRYIIKGTDVSFYIPPTGVTVEKSGVNENGAAVYTRRAVTLERLEYCILVGENGVKRLERGPAVVFPTPSERFLEHDGRLSFNLLSLNQSQGIHVKVIAGYEEDGEVYEEGEELFIRGDKTPIYMPREEHAIVAYDGKQKHFATTIPAGQGRYVLDRNTGEIPVVKGPQMFLADPRNQVIVRRPLTDEQVRLWYPGNSEALQYNRSLRDMMQRSPTTRSGVVSEGDYMRQSGRTRGRSKGISSNQVEASMSSNVEVNTLGALADEQVGLSSYGLTSSVGPETTQAGTKTFSNSAHMDQIRHGNQKAAAVDQFEEAASYNRPRTITFNNKFDGVPDINPWPGYAVLVADARGNRRVVQGPDSILLEYDEVLYPLSLSTGVPKNHDMTKSTTYLQVRNNKVSDAINVMTQDHVNMSLELSFRVDFEGDPNKWFEVENYVKLLTDHVRSVLMGEAKKRTMFDLYLNGVDVVRDTILGPRIEDKRVGMFFEENGMRVKDVEVLDIIIKDSQVAGLMDTARYEEVKNAIDLKRSHHHFEHVQSQEDISRKLAAERHRTEESRWALQMATIEAEMNVVLAKINSKIAEAIKKQEESKAVMEKMDMEHKSNLARSEAQRTMDIEFKKREQEIEVARLMAETSAVVDKFKAIDEEFVAAMTNVSNHATLQALAESVNLLKILGGDSLAGALGKIFTDTPLQSIIANMGVKIPVIEASANGKPTAQV